jgi:hypothetical protein
LAAAEAEGTEVCPAAPAAAAVGSDDEIIPTEEYNDANGNSSGCESSDIGSGLDARHSLEDVVVVEQQQQQQQAPPPPAAAVATAGIRPQPLILSLDSMAGGCGNLQHSPMLCGVGSAG